MSRRLSALSWCGHATLLLTMTSVRPAQAQSLSTSSPPPTFVFFQRTSGHLLKFEPGIRPQVCPSVNT